jgi:hypothetical protein
MDTNFTGDHRLLDHLIGPRQQRRRDREAKGLGGLEVDDELESRGLLHRQISRPGAFENPVDIASRATQLIVEELTP